MKSLFLILSVFVSVNIYAKTDRDYCQAKYKNATESRVDAKCIGHLPDSKATQKRVLTKLEMEAEYDLMNLYIQAINTDDYYLQNQISSRI